MEKNFSKGMMDMMFNVDFKQYIKVIEIFIKVYMLYKSRVGKKQYILIVKFDLVFK